MNYLTTSLLFAFMVTTACVPTWDEHPSNSYIPPHYYNQYNQGYNPYMYQAPPGYQQPQNLYQPSPYYNQRNYYSPPQTPNNNFQQKPTYYPQDNDQSYYYNYPPSRSSNHPTKNSSDYNSYGGTIR